MKREIYNDLLHWKNNEDRKPLIIQGARQVGKTWMMKEFGAQEYKHTIYINCDDEPLMQNVFEKDYDMERILFEIQVISGIKPEPEKTLIILDEIQEVPRGIHALKYFCEKVNNMRLLFDAIILLGFISLSLGLYCYFFHPSYVSNWKKALKIIGYTLLISAYFNCTDYHPDFVPLRAIVAYSLFIILLLASYFFIRFSKSNV